ncbi:MAG: hypothetical protein Q8L86_04870 [Vicinamibacterales bacterium]|nr:hypothetical protein [Vicinamibacterales bacterium]
MSAGPRPSLLPEPEVYKVAASGAPATAGDRSGVRVHGVFRALEGMQKEAMVGTDGPDGAWWRLVSDEGPYLNGTDLAPYPLAFFAAALQVSFLSELDRAAATAGVALSAVATHLDTRYTMAGSALRGDMTGGAEPAALRVSLATDAPADVVARLVLDAEASSPAHAVMRVPAESRFTLVANGRDVALPGAEAAPVPAVDPRPVFDTMRRASPDTWWPGIITRTVASPLVHGAPGGAGSSLQAEQKRTLHVVSTGGRAGAGAMAVDVGLRQPVGSTFRFLAPARGVGRAGEPAPSALVYLAAGVGFCFLTQLGRYAHITKQKVHGVRLAQASEFRRSVRGRWTPQPVTTGVFLDSDGDDADAARMVAMGRQTCFLHAAMRAALPTRMEVVLNGRPLPAPLLASAAAAAGD